MTNISWPVFDDEQIQAAARVLESGKVNYWTGQECKKFEEEFAKRFEVNKAISLANGTVALDLALQACRVGPGDDVVVTPRSFIASVSAVVLRGARPIFADVDPSSQNITAATIDAVVTPATKAVLPVHLAGWPCDMPDIMALAQDRGIRVIEDCAQSHGATIDGKSTGSFGDCSVFSFCQDKIMTTGGEGGMFVTSSDELWSRAWSFKDHGKSFEKMTQATPEPGFRFVHDEFGTNYRMTEFQAAIGRVQLERLAGWLEVRRRNADFWIQALAEIPGIQVVTPSQNLEHAYYKFFALIDVAALKTSWSRDRVLQELQSSGARVFSGICPEIYREAAFDAYPEWRPTARLPNARQLGESTLLFLVDPTVTEVEINTTAGSLREIMNRALN